MNIAIHATSKIKMVSFISGTFFLLNIPLMYVVMNLGSGAYIAYFVLIPIDIITTMVGVYIAKSLINQLNVKNVVFKGYGLNLLMIAIVLPVFYGIQINFDSGLLRLFLSTLASLVFSALFIYIVMLNKHQRKLILAKIGFFRN